MTFLGWLCIFLFETMFKVLNLTLMKTLILKRYETGIFSWNLLLLYRTYANLENSAVLALWAHMCAPKMQKNDWLISKLARAVKNNAISKPNISLERAGQELYGNMRENFSSLILTTKIEEEWEWGLIPGNPIPKERLSSERTTFQFHPSYIFIVYWP